MRIEIDRQAWNRDFWDASWENRSTAAPTPRKPPRAFPG